MEKHINYIWNILEQLNSKIIVWLSNEYILLNYNVKQDILIDGIWLESEESADSWINDLYSHTKNHIPNKYYHFTLSVNNILKNGFDFSKIIQTWVWPWLYLWKDKYAINNFYWQLRIDSWEFDNIDNLKLLEFEIDNNVKFLDITIHQFNSDVNKLFDELIDYLTWLVKTWEINNFYDILKEFNIDWIRYYDWYTTGEEFVLYNLNKIKQMNIIHSL